MSAKAERIPFGPPGKAEAGLSAYAHAEVFPVPPSRVVRSPGGWKPRLWAPQPGGMESSALPSRRFSAPQAAL